MQDNLQPAFLAPARPSLRYAGIFFSAVSANVRVFSQHSGYFFTTPVQSKSANSIPVWPSLSQVWYASILVCQARVIGPLLKLRPHCRNGTCPKYLPSQDFLISGLVLSLLKPQLVFAPTSSLIRLKPHENFDKTTKQC